jgi:hypothetical protein
VKTEEEIRECIRHIGKVAEAHPESIVVGSLVSGALQSLSWVLGVDVPTMSGVNLGLHSHKQTRKDAQPIGGVSWQAKPESEN